MVDTIEIMSISKLCLLAWPLCCVLKASSILGNNNGWIGDISLAKVLLWAYPTHVHFFWIYSELGGSLKSSFSRVRKPDYLQRGSKSRAN